MGQGVCADVGGVKVKKTLGARCVVVQCFHVSEAPDRQGVS